MPLIGVENNSPIDVQAKAHSIEDWCEKNVGPYSEAWYWVGSYGNNLVLRIIDDEAATLFRLVFCNC